MKMLLLLFSNFSLSFFTFLISVARATRCNPPSLLSRVRQCVQIEASQMILLIHLTVILSYSSSSNTIDAKYCGTYPSTILVNHYRNRNRRQTFDSTGHPSQTLFIDLNWTEPLPETQQYGSHHQCSYSNSISRTIQNFPSSIPIEAAAAKSQMWHPGDGHTSLAYWVSFLELSIVQGPTNTQSSSPWHS